MATDNPHQNITFPSNGHEAHGYLKAPESGKGPGLIVIQEWWGLTDHIVDVCDRFAKEGFVALAPDLYGGKVAHDADEAGKMMQALPEEDAARDLGGAVERPRGSAFPELLCPVRVLGQELLVRQVVFEQIAMDGQRHHHIGARL